MSPVRNTGAVPSVAVARLMLASVQTTIESSLASPRIRRASYQNFIPLILSGVSGRARGLKVRGSRDGIAIYVSRLAAASSDATS